MILEAIELVKAALEHSTEGVNAQLDAISRDSGDRVPPKIVRVLTETRDDVLARGDVPADYPLLLVTQYGIAEFAGEMGGNVNLRDALRVPLGIAYVRRDADSAQARRETLYTQRAILKALRSWYLGASREADRNKNGVYVIGIESISADEIRAEFGESVATGLVTPILRVRDTDA